VRTHTRAGVFLTALAALAALACCGSASALAAGSSIGLKGPHLNAYGTPFHYTASGRTEGAANYAVAWEVPYSPACAHTYKSESKRAHITLFARRTLAKNKHFSFVLEFFARNITRHRLCAYVISKQSGATLARGEATWRNYLPTLQPAPVGGGECGARRFPDESVYAQVALSGPTCEALESVAYGADAAKGAAYSRSGFTCTPTTESAGSKWSAAWAGTYYSYACISGNELAAFNWGAQYIFKPPSTVPLVKPGG
jgi:hypothetical protein